MIALCAAFLVTLVLEPGVSGLYYSRGPPQFDGLENIDKLAAAGGYRATNYEVLTEDGYYTWIHRLGNNTGPPVLIQHGLILAADVWLARHPKKSLAFMLLQRGYDVWLSNQRGTVNNQRHILYKRSDPRFWNFSFHESGYYDIPAFIDTILAVRKKKKLFYIGHSLGTTVFFVMASTRPEYNSKVEAAVLLSPIAFSPSYSEMSPIIRLIALSGNGLISALTSLGQFELGRRTEASISFLKKFCAQHSPTHNLCFRLFGLLVGYSQANVDQKELDMNQPYFGAGTSLKTFHHFLQIYQTGELRRFDYGPSGNLLKYNRTKAPRYRLSSITAPVAMIWSKNDPLLSATSVEKVAAQLPNLIFSKSVPDPSFSHIDMYIGEDADKLVYLDVINVLDSFSSD